MEHLGVQAKAKKKMKVRPKGKPFKVVYIANPKMVQTSASDFRALVQELTGNAGSMSTLRPKALESPNAEQAPRVVGAHVPGTPDLAPLDHETKFDDLFPVNSIFSMECFNDWILQEMLDGFTGFQSSGHLYEARSEL